MAEEEEPPSPSPLMLKIPTPPDPYTILAKNGAGPSSPTHRHHYTQERIKSTKI
jgi:hypothetical protein